MLKWGRLTRFTMPTLVFLRHGQSQWNLENRFTGWVNVPLSDNGREEARRAGEHLSELHIDKAYTTPLERANMTFSIAWEASGDERYPIMRHLEGRMKDWGSYTRLEGDKILEVVMTEELNERCYGDLQGLNKAETAEKFGKEQVHIWRRSYDTPPPGGESLKDTLDRALPFYEKYVEADLREGKNVLIVAHGNSLRAITKHLEGISDEEIPGLNIPTGVPIVYDLDKDLKVLNKKVLE